MTPPHRYLTVNPGSTSTKVATFVVESGKLSLEHKETIQHAMERLSAFHDVPDQFEFRKALVLEWLAEHELSLADVDVFVGRGGFTKPIPSGVYRVNEIMADHLRKQLTGSHPCNLGGLIVRALAEEAERSENAFIVDPAIVDEMDEIARLSGMPDVPRVSKVHCLNHKAVGHAYAESIGKTYADLNLIIVHMGGGTSTAAHQRGRMIDVNNGLDGEGAFTPERSGGVPTGDFMQLCYSGRFTLDEMKKKIKGQGGLAAYLNTTDAVEVERRIEEGDEKAALVYRAMAYQIAKDIGAFAAVLSFEVDAILLTGGLAFGTEFCDWIEGRVGKIAPVVRYPGGDEEMALANGVHRGLAGKRSIREYLG